MKILKHLETELEKVDTSQLTSTTATPTPTQILTTLVAFKGVFIAVLNFIKLFTSDTADAKIDSLIAWLNALPVAS
jgi:hypothetical protein